MDNDQKHFFRRDTGYIIRGLIWYSIVVSLVSEISVHLLQKGWTDKYTLAGAAGIISTLIGVSFLFIRNILFDKQTDIFQKTGKGLRLNTFAKLFCLLLMLQFLFSIAANLIEIILNSMGYTMENMISLATGEDDFNFAMILYSGIIGPVVEELIYRGFILRSLQKYGKVFALVLSSILFGMAHMIPIQIIFAIPAGMLFSYIAMEYSIKWAIFFHIANNLLLGDCFGWLLDQMPEPISSIVYLGVLAGASVIAIFVLVKGYQKLKKWFADHAPAKGSFRYVITLPSFLILCSYNILITIIMAAVSITSL